MHWKIYQLTYDLLAPLHLGLLRTGNVQRTRYYIPARTIWGALTTALTRVNHPATLAVTGSFETAGEWIKRNIVSSYWYVLGDNGQVLYPQYRDNTLRYGTMTERGFQNAFVTGSQGTAIDPYSNTAREESLREFEVLSPHRKDTGARVQFRGWLLLSREAQRYYEAIAATLHTLFVGGERRYGWGHLRLAEGPKETETFCTLPAEKIDVRREDLPALQLEQGDILIAHARTDAVRAKGAVEPFRGRITSASSRFGMAFSETAVCWVPGSILTEATTLRLSIVEPLGKA